MSERKAVTKTIARRYRGQHRAGKKVILDELCELTGWHPGDSYRTRAHRTGPPPPAPKTTK